MTSDREALEQAIRARCDEGDYEGAATFLLEGYQSEIMGFVMSRVRDAELAAEIFSSFTEDMWCGLPGFAFRCSARVWAYTLARHAASHEIRASRRRRRRTTSLLEAGHRLQALEQRVRSETLAAYRTEVKQRIVELRESLPVDDQSLLVLRVNRRLEWPEIAHVLAPEGAPLTDAALKKEAVRLRKRFQLLKERLRTMARAEGLIEQDD